MKLQEYLNMQNEYLIKNLSLSENVYQTIDKDVYKELYNHFTNTTEAFHLLTYSNDSDFHSTEFYVMTNELMLDSCSIINNDDVKLQINYNENTLVFTLNLQESKTKVPIVFDLVDKQISFELSQLLKQKYINLHFLSCTDSVLNTDHSVKVFITEKIKSKILESLELFLNYYNLEEQEPIVNFEDLLISTETSYLKITINRNDVETMNVSKYEIMLKTLYPNVLMTHNFHENVDLVINGYEDDTREIWQIPEVRKFVKKLNKRFDQWFYFLDKNSDSLYWLTMCLCGKGFGEKDKLLMNNLAFNDFINDQLKSLSELCYYLNDPNKYNEIKEGVFIYYGIIV
ncbi:hypothetical protein GC105_13650 [Alkalibaculum sp. M08DMB]|uniref:Uncharacterized protein n=1 Tax=Alkalibaculum sporogenes TaxID=2655001 RepID=A0A6A7KCC3_9FIRM|nr:hypothetical protein [Alkalibaculum sporogenes]MPW26827.1 hypothetical protein [Alkalibaculum sporogenes]